MAYGNDDPQRQQTITRLSLLSTATNLVAQQPTLVADNTIEFATDLVIGVAKRLELYASEPVTQPESTQSAPAAPTKRAAPRKAAADTAPTEASDGAAAGPCEDCGKPIEAVAFRDNTSWSAQELANRSKRKFGASVCMADYKLRNAASKAASS